MKTLIKVITGLAVAVMMSSCIIICPDEDFGRSGRYHDYDYEYDTNDYGRLKIVNLSNYNDCYIDEVIVRKYGSNSWKIAWNSNSSGYDGNCNFTLEEGKYEVKLNVYFYETRSYRTVVYNGYVYIDENNTTTLYFNGDYVSDSQEVTVCK
ncbi:MAG: hypothetical protein IKX23_05630 [Treponema sp.]|nr:hypothetical protein [Treponema sp.]